MSVFAIGDIHGSYIALKTLLEKLKKKGKEHTYIFLGDYVNKGSNSKKVLDYLIEFSSSHHCVFLKGNHDILMLKARKGKVSYKDWLIQGGDKTLESYQLKEKGWKEEIPNKHWQFLEETISYYEWNNNLFVHAGLEAGKGLKKQNKQVLFWNKNQKPVQYKKNKKVFCGHTAQKSGEIANFKHTILLDTYAWGGGWLTALNVESGKYYQTNNSGDLRKRKLIF